MRYQISGKQIDIGESLQSHVKAELGETVEKYAQRPTDALVTFSRNAHEYVCETIVHLSTGLTVSARATAGEVYAAFESCREKIDKQMRRHKRRLKDHHRSRSEPVEFSSAPSYVLSADDDSDGAAGDAPVVIAEMETKVATLSVGEAVMQLELAGLPLLVFRNEKHGGVNVVHRRDDGHIGWIDPRMNG